MPFFYRLLGQAKRVRPEASAGDRWSSHGPRRGRPQAGPVDGGLVHHGRVCLQSVEGVSALADLSLRCHLTGQDAGG